MKARPKRPSRRYDSILPGGFSKALVYAASGIALLSSLTAHASCGATFCSFSTGWEGRAAWAEPGTRVDLRLEYIDQDQPRNGRRRVDVGDVPRHDDEIRTINRNGIVTVDHTIDTRWGLSLQVPVVSRAHSHRPSDHDEPIVESWDIDRLGDLRLLATYHLQDGTVPSGWGVIGGVELPTGSYNETNEDGDVAERSLQPGSGTTDVIAGLQYSGVLPWRGVPLHSFADLRVQRALTERDDYRPGHLYTADVGVAYRMAAAWTGLLQINAQIRGRDRGREAVPEDTGGSYVWLSPGAAYSFNKQYRLYGLVQLPLYQRVNGVQLTADAAFVLGLSKQF